MASADVPKVEYHITASKRNDKVKVISDIKSGMNESAERLSRWRKAHIGDTSFMFIVVTVVGIFSGACAYLLKHAVAWVSRMLTSGLSAAGGNWILFVIPLAGIVLTGLVTRYVMRMNLSDGVRMLRQQLRRHDYRISPARIPYPLLASTITLGFGGSAGSEGPIACTGAAIGGNMGRWLGLPPHMVMIMIGCGAGAGIAGIFKSPLGGALFTLEVMRLPMTTVPVLALLVCTLAAGMTAYALGGFTLDLSMGDASAAFDISMLPFIIALGLVCGGYSLYYSYIMKAVGAKLKSVKRPLLRNIAGGAMLGLAVFLFPSLYGEGYGVIGHVLNGNLEAVMSYGPFADSGSGVWAIAALTAGTVVLKCFATSATNNGGGVSGNFAPTLFAGCMLGLLFVYVVKGLWHVDLPVGFFALMGMAGVMAGVIRAPLMALMLAVEMVGAYSSFFPLAVVAALSFGIVRLFTSDDYYSGRLDRPNGLMSKIVNNKHL